jgi:cytochrome c peroxidase
MGPDPRTPSLINVMNTPPYMHDGTFRDIEEVLWFYARRDVERNGSSVLLIENEREALKAFLETLTDVRMGKP